MKVELENNREKVVEPVYAPYGKVISVYLDQSVVDELKRRAYWNALDEFNMTVRDSINAWEIESKKQDAGIIIDGRILLVNSSGISGKTVKENDEITCYFN
jgi:hypothetical protein